MMYTSCFFVLMLLGSCTVADFVRPLPINPTKILKNHNDQRSALQINSLEWDVNLQKLAQQYSNKCEFSYTNPTVLGEGYAQLEEVVYDGTQEESIGENMATASSNVDISSWVNQFPNWLCIDDTCIPGTNCNQWKQLISSYTTSVGCGRSLCNNSTNSTGSLTWELLVCHYNPSASQQRTIPLSQCPLNCSWSNWSNWSPCCEEDGPVTVRSRVQKPGQPSGALCIGDSLQFADCNCSANYTYIPRIPAPAPAPVPPPTPLPIPVIAPAYTPLPLPGSQTRVINLISFSLKVKSNGTITPASTVKTTLQSIIGEWLGIDPRLVGIDLVNSTSGYLVTVSVTIFGSQPVPEAKPLTDRLHTQSAQNNITQLTGMNVDLNSITTISSPNPPAPGIMNNLILGIPLWGWIIIGVGVLLIVIVILLIVIFKVKDLQNRPWQEFV